MQFKVPQNVQIEDKILPFMTLRQFIICGVGGGFAYMLYLSLENQNTEVWLPPVAIVSALTLAIAFVQINNVSFIEYILLVIERYLTETKRTWIKSAGDIFLPDTPETKKNVVQEKKEKNLSLSELEKLSAAVDSGGLATETPSFKN